MSYCFNWWFHLFFIQDDAPRVNAENVLEDRDPQYDAMLNQMVGRIQAKPGGKLEMGEVSSRKLFFFYVFESLDFH